MADTAVCWRDAADGSVDESDVTKPPAGQVEGFDCLFGSSRIERGAFVVQGRPLFQAAVYSSFALGGSFPLTRIREAPLTWFHSLPNIGDAVRIA